MYGIEFSEVDFFDSRSGKVEFSIDFIDGMIYRYCFSAYEARLLVNKLQSLGGVKLERNGAFVYCSVENVDEAIEELKENGFFWNEVA